MGVEQRHHPAIVERWIAPDNAIAELPLEGLDEHGCILVNVDVLRRLLGRAGFEHLPGTYRQSVYAYEPIEP